MSEPSQEHALDQLVKYLKEDSILRLISESMIYGLSLNLEELDCGPGHVVFKEGDESDGFYIIRQGAVEVRREQSGSEPIAYLTQGECFGEMALLSGGKRNATIRVPEAAVLLKLPEHSFNNLREGFPALAKEFARLNEERGSGRTDFKAPGLQGNTAFFDLPTVIQAVAASHQSGWLKMFESPGSTNSRLAFKSGRLISAFTEHLSGEDAFYQLISIADPLDFVFDHCEDEELTREPANISTSTKLDALLIEGAKRVDELDKALDAIGGAEMAFKIARKERDLSDLSAEFRDLGPKLMSLIEVGVTVEDMYGLIDRDRFSIIDTLKQLVDLKVIEPAAERPAKVGAAAAVATQSEHRATVSAHGRSAPTAELDLRQLVKGPQKVASTLYALNMVASNLATIVDIATVSGCLQEALAESSQKFSQLGSLKVHRGGKTLDVRGASPELSTGADSAQALTFLTRKFLQLIAVRQAN